MDLKGNAKGLVLELLSKGLAVEGILTHEELERLKQLVREDNKSMDLMVDEEFRAMMNGTINEYNKRFDGLSFDDHLKMSNEALQVQPAEGSGLVGTAVQQLKGLAAYQNHYNLAVQEFIKTELHYFLFILFLAYYMRSNSFVKIFLKTITAIVY